MNKKILAVLTAGTLLVACNRNEDWTAPASDASKAELFYNDVQNLSDEACNTGDVATIKSLNGVMSGCATVTLDTTSSPRTAIIDFGTVNCMCTDGRNRRGRILVSFTGRYRDAGTVITISPDNYFINDNQVLGTHTVTNQGTNINGNIYYSVSVSGSIILANGNGTINWESTRTREWIAGSATPGDFSDDAYSITGNGTGTTAAGDQVSVNITSPLVRRLEPGCRQHFVSGTIEITPSGKPERILDFGSGSCDNQATVTVNGNTYNITLGN